MPFRKIFRFVARTISAILLFFLLYLIAALWMPFLPAHSDFQPCQKDAVEIYILSNGVHTDIVLPVKNEWKDWSTFVDPAETRSGSTSADLVSFGWGDKGFFLETPTWADLKFKTAFNALFFLGNSAMHVSFHQRLFENESCKKICISRDCYQKLSGYIEDSFEKDISGMPLLIKGACYSDNDAFYEANGTYNLFFTCNTWANSALKTAGLKACAWTPFDKGIFYQYK